MGAPSSSSSFRYPDPVTTSPATEAAQKLKKQASALSGMRYGFLSTVKGVSPALDQKKTLLGQ